MSDLDRSITVRLAIGLGTVVLASSVLLMLLVALDYGVTPAMLADPDMRIAVWSEIEQHVLWPMTIFVGATAIAIIPAIRLALGPLRQATRRIELAGNEHGFRLHLAKFPIEVQPFVGAINELLGRLDAAAERHEAFAADVAHELRTPLAVLSLELDQLAEPVRTRLKGDVGAMERLVSQLLLLAQIDQAAAGAMRRERIDLAPLAADVLAMLGPQAIAANRTVALDLADGPHEVEGWREAIAAAIRNLVENALHVTPAGKAVTVIVGPGAQVRVRDGGPGVTPAQLSALVGRKVRGDNANRSGAGLGLAIVERIMAAHGGTLSTVPERREFVLAFPAG